MVFRRSLERAGYVVREENDSTHALQSAHEFKPDLVLLDVHMPGMDGCEVAKQFACDDGLRKIPVAFISGGSEHEALEKMRPADISFLGKPIGVGMLLDFVREHLPQTA